MDAFPASVIHILLIDDDREFCTLLGDYLELNSISIECAHSGKDGLRKVQSESYDLILLDMFLPDINGLDIIRKIRQRHYPPIVMISAHNDETDRIIALELGADDYVAKSLSSRELLARIRAVLRRWTPSRQEINADAHVVHLHGLRVNNLTKEAFLEEESLNLTLSEFQILFKLISNPGVVFSREALLSSITERDFNKYDRSIDMHISSLRRKLRDDLGDPRFIRTLRGMGYSFIR